MLKTLQSIVEETYRAARAARIQFLRNPTHIRKIEASDAQEAAADSFRCLQQLRESPSRFFQRYYRNCIIINLAAAAACAGRAQAYIYITDDEDFGPIADWAKEN